MGDSVTLSELVERYVEKTGETVHPWQVDLIDKMLDDPDWEYCLFRRPARRRFDG